MIQSLKIIRNSLFLSLQPLFLNLISLFVVGYIARKLGAAEFGIFNFVTAFTMLFYPLAVLGLNRITVRDLSSLKDRPEGYAQKMFSLRVVTAIFAVAVIVLIAKAANYPDRTLTAIYLATVIFSVKVITESLTDIFNAFQRMEFTALTGLVSGLTLTALSVLILYLNYGLYELLGVYAFGQALGLSLAFYWITKRFLRLRCNFSWTFSKQKLSEGSQFFLMTMMWFMMTRIDTIFLSKAVTMEQLGLYTAALLLITKLSVIPQAVSSALLPAFSEAYVTGNMDDISNMWGALISKILLFALPFVITISVFADEIVAIIFGSRYGGAGSILRLGISAFLFTCVTFCEFSLLTAVRKQRFMLYSYLIAGVYCLAANLILIKLYHAIGAVIAYTSTQFLILILFTFIATKSIQSFLRWKPLLWITTFNLCYFLFLIGVKGVLSYISIPAGFIIYLAAATMVKVIEPNDFHKFKNAIRNVC